MKLMAAAINIAALALLVVAGYLILPFVLKHVYRDPIITPDAGDVATLLVLFQPKDCTSYMSFITDWRRVEEDSITIVGIPVNANDPVLLEHAVAAFPVQFSVRPTLVSPALALASQLGRRETPMAILLDSRGSARMLISGSEATGRQLDIENLVMSYRRFALRSAP